MHNLLSDGFPSAQIYAYNSLVVSIDLSRNIHGIFKSFGAILTG